MLHPSVHSGWCPSSLYISAILGLYVHFPHLQLGFGLQCLPLPFWSTKNVSHFPVTHWNSSPWYLQLSNHPCPHNLWLTSYYCFSLILLLIKIHCINVCSSLLCYLIFDDMDHALLIFVFLHSSCYINGLDHLSSNNVYWIKEWGADLCLLVELPFHRALVG